MTSTAQFSTTVFMECDYFPNNEVSVKISGYYVEPERGSRDEYGAPLEPDFGGYFNLTSIYIEDFCKSVELDDAAEIFERPAKELEAYFCEQLAEAYENDDDSIWF